jgi:ring-1,2-phenylacetyl-CoA epoxidase subunit PaaE
MLMDLQLRVKEVIQETGDANTYILENVTGQQVPYEAGQFLTFIINLNGQEVRRSYSLSSSPGFDKDLSMIIKRAINGKVSRYLFNHLKTSDVLDSLIPTGRIICTHLHGISGSSST